MLQKLFYDKSFFFNLCNEDPDDLLISICNFFTSVGFILVGPIETPIELASWWQETFSEEEKKKHDMGRKRWWFVDSVSSFVSHGTVLIITIILWETTSVLDQNLSVCTFPLIRNSISIICGVVMTLSALNCLLSYLYYKL